MSSGGSALPASLVYLGVTNTEFHEGGVGSSNGVAQFVSVPIGLVLGGTALALTPQRRRTGRLSDFIPDGLLLVVATILLGGACGGCPRCRMASVARPACCQWSSHSAWGSRAPR